MGRVHDEFQDPFAGVAVSVTTSNIIDTRYVFDLTLSIISTSGGTSTHTWQLSNDGSNLRGTAVPPEASWSHWTILGETDASEVSTLDPPLGYAWARVIREASGGSYDLQVHKLYRL